MSLNCRFDDLLFDPFGPSARAAFPHVARRPNQPFPRGFRQIVGIDETMHVDLQAEGEQHALFVPTIEMLRLAEVRVAEQVNAAKARRAAQGDRLVQTDGHALVRRPIAGAIRHPQDFARIAERDGREVIAALAVVGEVRAFLAFARRGNQNAIHIQARFLERLRRLPRPDIASLGVERLVRRFDMARREPPAEVAGRGGIGDPIGAQRVEVSFVLAPQLQVFRQRPPHTALQIRFSTLCHFAE